MEITTYLGDIRFLKTDLILAGLFRDERPPQGLAGLADWFLFGQLTELLLTGAYAGDAGRFALVATQGRIAAPRLMLIGLGDRAWIEPDSLRELWKGAALGLGDLKVRSAAVEFIGADGRPCKPEPAARLMLDGFLNRARPPVERLLIVPAGEEDQETLEKLIR